MSYAEPPDGSIVGWGQPIVGCAVRLDAAAAEGGWGDARWYPAEEGAEPYDWSDLVTSMYGDEFYVLVRQPAVDALPPDGPPALTPPG